jgi:hypothetical protein
MPKRFHGLASQITILYNLFVDILQILFYQGSTCSQKKYYSLALLSIVLLLASKAAVAITPLLYHDYRPVPEIRGRGLELLLSSNIAPRFEDTERKETSTDRRRSLKTTLAWCILASRQQTMSWSSRRFY